MIVGGGTVPATNLTRQEVHRPRPPHVAAISMPAACAPFRIDVAGGSASVRRGAGSRGSVRIVRGTAMPPPSSGMLAPMGISLDTLKRMSRLAGFDWSDAELEAIRPAVTRTLDLLAGPGPVPLPDGEPATPDPGVLDAGPGGAPPDGAPAHGPYHRGLSRGGRA